MSPPLRPRQPLIYFLTLWICLLWTFHINRIIQYVVFWFLSLTVFSKFIHFVAYVNISFLFMAENPLYG